MLCLRFTIGACSYGLDVSNLVELVPCVALSPIPRAPLFIAGRFNYRGDITPVVDVSCLCGLSPAKRSLSSRIAISSYRSSLMLGLLLEGATETVLLSESSLRAPCANAKDTPFLGREAIAGDGSIIRLIKPDELLSEEAREILFPNPEGS